MSNFSNAATVRIEPHGGIWTAMIFNAGHAHIGALQVLTGDLPDHERRVKMQQVLATRCLDAGDAAGWLPGPDGVFVLPVVPI